MDTTITGHTKLFALLGSPVSHSISPAIHNSIFAEKKLDSKYIALNIAPGSLRHAVTVLRENFGGFNVTIPHKQAIIDYLDDIHPQALLYGAVNTVKNVNGRLIGFNTDGYGFIKAFEQVNIDISQQRVLVVGAGGAARAVLCELLQRHCQVTIINRTLAKAERLQQELAGRFPGSVTVAEPQAVKEEFFCLINTTPVGMAPDTGGLPVDPSLLGSVNVVYDLIYNPYKTVLLRKAGNYGCKTINGFPMLFYQAVEANRIWTEKPLSANTEQKLYKTIAKYLQDLQSAE